MAGWKKLLTSGDVVNADLSGSAGITGDNIASDTIDSDHYAAGSIDNEHLADNAVDSDEIADGAVDFAHIQDVAANSVLGRNANSSGVLSEVALATTEILIGDGTGFTAAALSGAVTMANDGTVTIGNDKIDSQHYVAASIDNEHLADDAVGIDELSATGTADSSTYLRGDNTWAAGGIDTWRPVTADGNTLAGNETLAFTEGATVTITEAGGAVTIASTDTNTTTTADVLSALNADWGGNKTFGTQPDDIATFSGDVTVSGDLIVSGDTTTLNIDTLSVEDKLVILSSGAGGGTTAAADASGLVVNTDETNEPSLKWYKDAAAAGGPFHWAMTSRNDPSSIGVAGIQIEVTTGSPADLETVGGLFAYNNADGTMYFYDDV